MRCECECESGFGSGFDSFLSQLFICVLFLFVFLFLLLPPSIKACEPCQFPIPHFSSPVCFASYVHGRCSPSLTQPFTSHPIPSPDF
jgi:hypothetical protein